MSGKDLHDAAERLAKRKEILKQQIPMKPDAPGNIKLSKAQFIAKRREDKEEDVAVAEFKAKRKAEKETPKEVENGVQERKEEKVKKGRAKKVE